MFNNSLRYVGPVERFRNILGRLIRLRHLNELRYIFRRYQSDQKVLDVTFKHTYNFIANHLIVSPRLNSDADFLSYVDTNNFDGYIVGSDQCWRPIYSPNIYNYFLDFCVDEENLKRVAYAASFGVDDWEYSHEQTKRCSELIRKFDAVSVRESSGVNQCAHFLNYLGAIHLLDPTMLLEPKDYINKLGLEAIEKSEGNLFAYMLDSAEQKRDMIQWSADKLGLTPFSVKAKYLYEDTTRYSMKECTQPPVEQWLRGFMDAEYIITDSFHGCVFSILFNKPFVAIGNIQRGLARFNSLLKTFDLESRLITDTTTTHQVLSCPIDWDSVNLKRKELKEKSIRFLADNLLC